MIRRPGIRTAGPRSEQEEAPEAPDKASRGLAARLDVLRRLGPLRLALLTLGIGAGLLMILTEFSTLAHVEVLTASCQDLAQPELADTCETSGGEQHRYALLLLGLLTIAMTLAAVLLGLRTAAAALMLIGIVVLAVALIGDLPDTRREGAIGVRFTEAEAKKGAGFTYELIGGALAAIVGGMAPWALRQRERHQ